MHNFIKILASYQNSGKKLMIQFYENIQTDRRTDGRMEGQTDPVL